MSVTIRPKPGRWALTPSAADPAWAWAWRNIVLALPFWEGGGVPWTFGLGQPTTGQAVTGGAAWVGTPYGAGFRLNGSTQALRYASGSDASVQIGAVTSGRAITAEMLCRLAATPAATSFFGFRDNNPPFTGFHFSYNLQGTRQLEYYGSGTGANWAVSSTANLLDDGGWHHVAVVVSGQSGAAGTATFYVDGIARGGGSTGLPGNFAGGHVLGGWESLGGYWLNGDIAVARLWNRALQGAEIARLAADPFGMFRRADEAPYVYSTPPPPGGSGARSFVVISA